MSEILFSYDINEDYTIKYTAKMQELAYNRLVEKYNLTQEQIDFCLYCDKSDEDWQEIWDEPIPEMPKSYPRDLYEDFNTLCFFADEELIFEDNDGVENAFEIAKILELLDFKFITDGTVRYITND